jgi:23S rRNA (adenine2030-N6)-methyltransferase
VNYRHAFHAGNVADVLKHALLARMLAHLGRKDAPYRFVDTHAGIGLYDLAGDEASRTGEWREGIGRMEAPFDAEVEAVLSPFRTALARVRERFGPDAYPGSPLLALEAMRPGDRAVFCELHEADRQTLAARLRRDRRAKVLGLDGWMGLGALLPPPERRGLVLVDPPYEVAGELAVVGRRLLEAVRRWPTGMFALWYPVKDEATLAGMAAEVAAHLTRPGLRIELTAAKPDGTGLAGSGLIVVNPPWTLEAETRLLLPALLARLDRGGRTATTCTALG